MHRFNKTGVAAGTAKRFQVLSTPAPRATSDMKAMYGNIQRVMTTAISKPRGSCCRPLAMAHTRAGAAATPMMLSTNNAQVSTVAAWLITAFVAASPCCALEAASTGTKAWLKAPSAKKRRNRLGMRNATLKASVTALAPKVDAIRSSRTSPEMRDTRVSRETMEADLKRLTGRSVAAPGKQLLESQALLATSSDTRT